MHLLKQYAPFEKCDVISHMIIKTAHKFVFFFIAKVMFKKYKSFLYIPRTFLYLYIFYTFNIVLFNVCYYMLIIFVVV